MFLVASFLFFLNPLWNNETPTYKYLVIFDTDELWNSIADFQVASQDKNHATQSKELSVDLHNFCFLI